LDINTLLAYAAIVIPIMLTGGAALPIPFPKSPRTALLPIQLFLIGSGSLGLWLIAIAMLMSNNESRFSLSLLMFICAFVISISAALVASLAVEAAYDQRRGSQG
jgi:hypothetical protein